MSRSARIKPRPPADEGVAARILAQARIKLFSEGYLAFTMDALARDLAISKKTVYVHFRSKEAIVAAIVEAIHAQIRTRTIAVASDPTLGFPMKLSRIIGIVTEYMVPVRSELLEELARHAPGVYDKIEEIRRSNIPRVFGQLLRQGIVESLVRPDIDPDFAAHFLVQAMNGLQHPASLRRTGLTMPQAMMRAIDIYFGGILMPACYQAYRDQEQALPRGSDAAR